MRKLALALTILVMVFVLSILFPVRQPPILAIPEPEQIPSPPAKVLTAKPARSTVGWENNHRAFHLKVSPVSYEQLYSFRDLKGRTHHFRLPFVTGVEEVFNGTLSKGDKYYTERYVLPHKDLIPIWWDPESTQFYIDWDEHWFNICTGEMIDKSLRLSPFGSHAQIDHTQSDDIMLNYAKSVNGIMTTIKGEK